MAWGDDETQEALDRIAAMPPQHDDEFRWFHSSADKRWSGCLVDPIDDRGHYFMVKVRQGDGSFTGHVIHGHDLTHFTFYQTYGEWEHAAATVRAAWDTERRRWQLIEEFLCDFHGLQEDRAVTAQRLLSAWNDRKDNHRS